jgi:septum site-determining protein MinC
MTVLRGKGLGLEVVLADDDVAGSLTELESRLSERPDFYRGTSATAAFGEASPTAEQLDRLRELLESGGISLRAISGGSAAERVAQQQGLAFEAAAPPHGGELERRRAMRPRRPAQLSESARSLVADFAGARADIAARRKGGQASVPRFDPPPEAPPASAAAPPLAPAPERPAALYHVGTIRGGQSLQHAGNIVVVGDVNPGAELVATGDIVVFGSLRGVAHAGAGGDADARVFALDLSATQLRIATCIAADDSQTKQTASVPEAAVVRDGRIVIVAYDRIDRLTEEGASTR